MTNRGQWHHLLMIGILFALVGVVSIAQQTPAPQFEAASIKPTMPGAKGLGLPEFRGNRLRMINSPAVFLLVRAFDVRSGVGFQQEGTLAFQNLSPLTCPLA